MVWIFLLGAGFFILGGLLAVQPTKTQKRISRLRESAMKAGLHVKLPVSLKFPESKHKSKQKSDSPYYCLVLKDRKLANMFAHISRQDLKYDQLESTEALLAEELKKLNEDYSAIYLGSGMVGISWNEAREEQVPRVLIEALSRLEKALV